MSGPDSTIFTGHNSPTRQELGKPHGRPLEFVPVIPLTEFQAENCSGALGRPRGESPGILADPPCREFAVDKYRVRAWKSRSLSSAAAGREQLRACFSGLLFRLRGYVRTHMPHAFGPEGVLEWAAPPWAREADCGHTYGISYAYNTRTSTREYSDALIRNHGSFLPVMKSQ